MIDQATLLTRLANPDDAAALAAVFVDFALARPARAVIDPERVLRDLDRALAFGLVERFAETHVRGFAEREAERAADRGDRVGDWLTAETKAELRAAAAKPMHLDRDMLEKLVEQDAVRHLLRAVVQETLDRFVATFKPGGSGGGLVGAMGRSAVGIAGRAGKGLLGSLGAQVEGQLRGAVSTFVEGSMDFMLGRLVNILASPEMARQIGRTRLHAFEVAMDVPTVDVWRRVAREEKTLATAVEVLPGQVVHDLTRPEARAVILAEMRRWLEVEGETPIAELLAEDDAQEALRAELIGVLGPMLTEFGATEGFAGWLGGA
ncbi:MAG: hypothetical protein KC620_19890 [Myxococcales bacterium]|nr:hypothetical protein [Myxococcales bacterium]